jgi:CRISPR/Cas system-associated endonuclease Cas1
VFADGQCCVKQDDREVRISIEDLAWAVIDTPQASLASALMAACMEAGVAIVLATRHTLSGLVLPFHRHHRQSVIARLQADAKDSLKKRLRQEMVRRKILNQSAVLVAVLRFPPDPSGGDQRDSRTLRRLATYHGEIGREATAVAEMLSHPRPAYHGEIGREATAQEHESAADV